jgi:hypothetical protein
MSPTTATTLSLVGAVATFIWLVFGGGLALAARLRRHDSLEAFCLGVCGALALLFFAGFGVFAFSLPRLWWQLLSVLPALGLLTQLPRVRLLCADPAWQRLAVSWLLFALWALGLLACISTYSGGHWAGDWIEHHERAEFIRHGGPLDQPFLLGTYTFTARPPLANAITAVLLELSHGPSFPSFQIFTALLGSLVLLPVTLLVRRWSPSAPRFTGAAAIALLLLMLSPMVAQNLTFSWTKLPTAFWVLVGSYFLLRGLYDTDNLRARVIGFLALSLGLLCHYSAGVWIVLWLLIYAAFNLHRWRRAALWRETALHAAFAALVLCSWFGWAFANYGWQGTIQTNTTAEYAAHRSTVEWLKNVAVNTRDALVPHFFRDVPIATPVQASALGALRDSAFHFYQTNVFGLLGLVGCAASLLFLAASDSPLRSRPRRTLCWGLAALGAVVLNSAVQPWPDALGQAHLCLLPLALLGLGWVAAQLNTHPRLWKCCAIIAALDFALGIGLQFALASLAFTPLEALAPAARMNHTAELVWHVSLLRAWLPRHDLILLSVLSLTLLSAIFLTYRIHSYQRR